LQFAPFNRARFDDSNTPGIKTIEEELGKRTGVDGFFAVHHKYSGKTLQRELEIFEILNNGWHRSIELGWTILTHLE
jgi:hypothetical protein